MKNTMMYHKEYDPEGRVHDLDVVNIDELVRQGWVDNPAKLGINLWNDDPETTAAVKDIETEFVNKRLGPLDDVVVLTGVEEAQRLTAENEQLYKRIREVESEREALKRSLRESKEKLADHRSDAARESEKTPAEVAQIGAAAERRIAAAKAEGQPETPAPTPEATPEAAPETPPAPAPEATPESPPAPTPETPPAPAPEATPETPAGGTAPEAGTGDVDLTNL